MNSEGSEEKAPADGSEQPPKANAPAESKEPSPAEGNRGNSPPADVGTGMKQEAVADAGAGTKPEALGNASGGAKHEALGNASEGTKQKAVGNTGAGAKQEALGNANEGAKHEALGNASEGTKQKVVGNTGVGAKQEALGNASEGVKQASGNASEGDKQGTLGDPGAGVKQEALGNASEGAKQETMGNASEGAKQEILTKDSEGTKQKAVGNTGTGAKQEALGNASEGAKQEIMGNASEGAKQEILKDSEGTKQKAVGNTGTGAKQALGNASEGAKQETLENASEGAKQEILGNASEGAKQETLENASEGAKQTLGNASEGAKQETLGNASEGDKQKALGDPGAGATQKPLAEGGAEAESEGEKKRFSGAARRRFKILVSKGYTEEEARELALHTPREKQPMKALKRILEEESPAPPKKKKKKGPLRKHLTFHTPPAVLRQPLGGIRVALICADYPQALLSSDQQTLLREEVLEKLVPEKKGGFRPRFLGTSPKPGFIIFHCEDTATVLWLKTVMRKLEAIVNANLRALDHFEIPRKLVIVGYFPNKKRENIIALFDDIKEQNEGLNVDAWVLHKLITIRGVTQAIFAVDHQSAETLIKKEFKITFKHKEIELKPDVKFQKNMEAPVFLPKDTKGAGASNNKRPPNFHNESSPGDPSPNMFGPHHAGNSAFPRPMIPPHARYGPPSRPGGYMGGNLWPVDQSSWGNRHACPDFPPQMSMVAQQWIPPSESRPNLPLNYVGPGNMPRAGTNLVPQNTQSGNKLKGSNRQHPDTEYRGQNVASSIYSDMSSNQGGKQEFGPPSRNPNRASAADADQPPSFGDGHSNRFSTPASGGSIWSRPPDDYSNSEVDRPQKITSRENFPDRGPMSGTDRAPRTRSRDGYSNRDSASEDGSRYSRLGGNYPHGSSLAEADRRPRVASRDRYLGRSSPSGEDGRRYAAPRDTYSHHGANSGSEGRPRSRSRDYADLRSVTDAARQPWASCGENAGRAPRGRSLDYSDRHSAAEADRPPWDLSRDGFSNRESAAEAERNPSDQSREYAGRGAEIEADRSPWGPSRGNCERGAENEAGTSRERFSNRGSAPGADRLPWCTPRDSYSNRGSAAEAGRPPWDTPQDIYSSRGSASEATRHPRRSSAERHPNSGPVPEDGRPPWSMTRDSYSDRGEANVLDTPPTDMTEERHSNRRPTEDVTPSWGAPRNRLSSRGSTKETNRPPWGASRDNYLNRGSANEAVGPSRALSRETYPNSGSAAEDDRPPWARSQESSVASETVRLPWAVSRDNYSNRSSATEVNRPPRGTSGIRSPVRYPGVKYPESGSAAADNRHGTESRDRQVNRGSEIKAATSPWDPSREDFSNRGSATEMDSRQWTATRDRSPNRGSAIEADRRPWAMSSESISNRDSVTEVDRSSWGMSGNTFSNRSSTADVDGPPRYMSRDTHPNPGSTIKADRPPRGTIEEGYSNRGAVIEDGEMSRGNLPNRGGTDEVGRPQWITSRDSFPHREFAGGRQRDATADSYPNRGREPLAALATTRDSSSFREFPVEAGSGPRGISGDSYLNRDSQIEVEHPPWANSRNTFSNVSHSNEKARESEKYSRGNYSNFHEQRPSGQRNIVQGLDMTRDGLDPRPPAGRELREQLRSFPPRGAPNQVLGETNASFRDPYPSRRPGQADGTGREQSWRGRPNPGPSRGPVDGGRFYW